MNSGDSLLFFLLSLIYLASFGFSLVRTVTLMRNQMTWKLTRLFYVWILIQTLLRTITFAVAMLGQHTGIDYLLLNIPDSLFISAYLILFWQLITVCMLSHVTSTRTLLKNIKTKRLALTARVIILVNALWLILEAVLYFLVQCDLLHSNIKEFEMAGVNLLLPIAILLFCCFLQIRYSGVPFRSRPLQGLMKANTRVVLIWSLLRVIRGVIGLVAVLSLGTNMVDGMVNMSNSDHIFAGIVFIIALLLSEVLCFFFVLDSAFFKKFLFTTDLQPFNPNTSASPAPFTPNVSVRPLLDIPASPFINSANIEELEPIASRKHGLGQVLKASLNGQIVAVRRIDFPRMNNYVFEEVLDEVEHLAISSSPHVLPLLGGCLEQPSIRLVMPYVANGSLFKLLHEQKTQLTKGEKVRVMKEVCAGMDEVYRQQRQHGHLNSHNVLMDAVGAKVTDIGLHKLKKFAGVVIAYSNKGAWTSPEQLQQRSKTVAKIRESDDVYSFGVVMWEIWTGEQPFVGVGVDKLRELVAVQNLRPSIPSDIDEDLNTLIRFCWNEDPSHRPTFSHLLDSLTSIQVSYLLKPCSYPASLI